MHWIYILRCSDNYYYIGETTRLYRRFWEHLDGKGGTNTSIYYPEEIIGIYKVNTICKFIEYNNYINDIIDGNEEYKLFKLRNFNEDNIEEDYDYLFAENYIVECFMINRKNEWDKIRGGKYTRLDIEYNYPNDTS